MNIWRITELTDWLIDLLIDLSNSVSAYLFTWLHAAKYENIIQVPFILL